MMQTVKHFVNFQLVYVVEKCTCNYWSVILEHTNRNRNLFKKSSLQKPLVHYFFIECYDVELGMDCILHFCHYFNVKLGKWVVVAF